MFKYRALPDKWTCETLAFALEDVVTSGSSFDLNVGNLLKIRSSANSDCFGPEWSLDGSWEQTD